MLNLVPHAEPATRRLVVLQLTVDSEDGWSRLVADLKR